MCTTPGQSPPLLSLYTRYTQVHVESADIIRWVDAAFEGPALVPADAAARRDMEVLLKGACAEVVSAGLDLMSGEVGRLAGWLAWVHCLSRRTEAWHTEP